MKKLIHLTEDQYKRILEDGTYIDVEDNTHGYDPSQTTTTSALSSDGKKKKFGNPTITDKIGNGMTTQYPRGVTPCLNGLETNFMHPNQYKSMDCRKRELKESNKDLTGKQNTFQLSDESRRKLLDRYNQYRNENGNENSPGIKTAKNIISRGKISYDNAYALDSRMKDGSVGQVLDPDGTIQNEIENKIKTGENISKSSRDLKKSMGQNVIKSAPKDGTKGGAHSPSKPNENFAGVNYFK